MQKWSKAPESNFDPQVWLSRGQPLRPCRHAESIWTVSQFISIRRGALSLAPTAFGRRKSTLERKRQEKMIPGRLWGRQRNMKQQCPECIYRKTNLKAPAWAGVFVHPVASDLLERCARATLLKRASAALLSSCRALHHHLSAVAQPYPSVQRLLAKGARPSAS